MYLCYELLKCVFYLLQDSGSKPIIYKPIIYKFIKFQTQINTILVF